MSSEIDVALLSSNIKSKRGTKGLRETAKEIGEISASTLSRVEQGKLPDLESFFKICKWLKSKPEKFMIQKIESDLLNDQKSIKETIEVHLRADKTLSKETSEALVKMIEIAYENESAKNMNK